MATSGRVWVHRPDSDKRYWFLVWVYDTHRELVDAAHRYHPWHGREWHEQGQAVVQGASMRWKSEWGPDAPARPPANGFCGVVRFHRGYLGANVVAHEAVHAAGIIYRLHVEPRLDLGEECEQVEEALAYLVGDLTWALNDLLHKMNAYDEAYQP